MEALLSYGNQFFDLQSKSMDWFLYDNSLHLERVKMIALQVLKKKISIYKSF